jgi:hypothetical protein
LNAPAGDGNSFNVAGTGIFGASYPIAAGIYKNLGYLPAGYDGADNNGNGYVDEWAEGVCQPPQFNTPDPATVQLVQSHLANHTHNTARSEMLYAILVEGRGPLGSVFKADDFTEKEVKDTDGDGLPEFVDAWGNPLQFFRWPIMYHSDVQRGQVIQNNGANAGWALLPPYFNPTVLANGQNPLLNMFQERELDPLDQNQQLVVPTWWWGNANGFAGGYTNPTVPGASGAVRAFEYYFHRLSEPLANPASQQALFWDRGTSAFAPRRAFYSKFLIVSGGLDGQLGVFLYSDLAMTTLAQNAAWPLIANENNALPFSAGTRPGLDVVDFTQSATIAGSPPTITFNSSPDPSAPSSSDLLQAAQDDISNQNIQTTVAIGGG